MTSEFRRGEVPQEPLSLREQRRGLIRDTYAIFQGHETPKGFTAFATSFQNSESQPDLLANQFLRVQGWENVPSGPPHAGIIAKELFTQLNPNPAEYPEELADPVELVDGADVPLLHALTRTMVAFYRAHNLNPHDERLLRRNAYLRSISQELPGILKRTERDLKSRFARVENARDDIDLSDADPEQIMRVMDYVVSMEKFLSNYVETAPQWNNWADASTEDDGKL